MKTTLLAAFFALSVAHAEDSKVPPATVADQCFNELKKLPGKSQEADLRAACEKVQIVDGCASVHGTPIFHFDKIGTQKHPKKILAKALIHGDELTAGVVARAWMQRLAKIDSRNSWRIIPIANPDGLQAKTRYNSNGVDLNRNFPSADWEDQALAFWKKNTNSDKRRYPGPSAASEVETKCLLKHFEEFKPDFIISIHTPIGVLDLDGPKLSPPTFKQLPWHSLGNFPGSLGRYMWKDQNIPVLTIELKADQNVEAFESFDRLQDISGSLAIQADQMKPKTPPKKDKSSAIPNSDKSASNFPES